MNDFIIGARYTEQGMSPHAPLLEKYEKPSTDFSSSTFASCLLEKAQYNNDMSICFSNIIDTT